MLSATHSLQQDEDIAATPVTPTHVDKSAPASSLEIAITLKELQGQQSQSLSGIITFSLSSLTNEKYNTVNYRIKQLRISSGVPQILKQDDEAISLTVQQFAELGSDLAPKQ
ncbi:hypothetical protein Anapl_07995 [Anas platyrhynchos]|uniref:Uncharacterized protein n=1 Tax=Anas platyrhynchos TaxID=8839 RepID=R0KDD5_ANAPL|nr:hypothetical protein Anapl_07995 [Anas platyrhynchos]